MASTTSEHSTITVDNWQEPGSLAWSFLHMDELFPTAGIDAASHGLRHHRARRIA